LSAVPQHFSNIIDLPFVLWVIISEALKCFHSCLEKLPNPVVFELQRCEMIAWEARSGVVLFCLVEIFSFCFAWVIGTTRARFRGRQFLYSVNDDTSTNYIADGYWPIDCGGRTCRDQALREHPLRNGLLAARIRIPQR
jgi:hypothetical protein